MVRKLILLFLVGLSLTSSANLLPDKPDADETFQAFLIRITRGGTFQGIRAEATPKFTDAFYHRINRSGWVSARDKVIKRLANQNVNVWTDWYQAQNLLDIVLPTESARSEFFPFLIQAFKTNPNCSSQCRDPEILRTINFDQWTSDEVYGFTMAYIRLAPIFGGKTLVDHLGQSYELDANTVLQNTQYYLLNAKDFEIKLRELGWQGPIYFKGISYPDPKDPSKRHIMVNFDLTKKMSPYDRPLLRFLEFVGLFVHESSHVFQDFEAKKNGIDLQIKSAEGVLLLEGMAENFAEQAMTSAGATLVYPSALELYSTEQGLEVLYREGNETQGNLFPYTVGLPFAAAIFDSGDSANLRNEIYKTIDLQNTLTEFIKKNF